MVLTTDKTKSLSGNLKTDCGVNRSFFTPCKRVGLSRKVVSTTKKITATNCSTSPCNTIVPISDDTSCKLEKNKATKCNKRLGVTQRSASINGMNVSLTLKTSDVTINDFSSNTSKTDEVSSNAIHLNDCSTSKKSDSGQISNDEESAQEKVLTYSDQVILQQLIEKENVSEATTNCFIHNKSEKDKITAMVKKDDIVKEENNCENESFIMYDKKKKIKIASKPTRKRFSNFFSTKTSFRTSDSEDDFISLSQRSSGSEESIIKTKKQQHKSEGIVKSRPQKKKKSICSSDEEEFVSTFKKKCSKSISSFSDTHSGTSKELKEQVFAKEQQIKEKEKTLAELKLIETYRKLHDVNKLEKSITVWRKGFNEAFTDLHSKLKVHGADCSTSTLFNQLLVPNSVRKSCSFTEAQ